MSCLICYAFHSVQNFVKILNKHIDLHNVVDMWQSVIAHRSFVLFCRTVFVKLRFTAINNTER